MGAGALHRPVLLAEVLRHLAPERGGLFVDATVGPGGHAEAILAASPAARVVGFDRDAASLAVARQRLALFGDRVRLHQTDFRDLAREARALGIEMVDGILFDLGLSSLQLERSGRGFTFQADEPLDMRYDTTRPGTAAELLRRAPEPELVRILREYGEERAARRIARRIVLARGRAPLATTGALARLVAAAIPAGRRPRRIHPATRTFQALRIAVNDELGALEAALPQAAALLGPGGRLAVISFHSLEDRLVKTAFRRLAAQGAFSLLTPKPVGPSRAEVQANPRARSAKLRVLARAA